MAATAEESLPEGWLLLSSAELLIDGEEDRTLRSVLIGMPREAERRR